VFTFAPLLIADLTCSGVPDLHSSANCLAFVAENAEFAPSKRNNAHNVAVNSRLVTMALLQ
jgi:hypothetical protein